jgi:hypothetical protein
MDTKDLLTQAKEALENKKFDDCKNLLEQVLEQNSENEEAKRLLITCIEKDESSMNQEDFAKFMDATMDIQEIDSPEVKDTHIRLSLEYDAIYKKVEKFFITQNEETEESLFQELRQEPDISSLALLNFLKNLKKLKDSE